jgi:hypothetical protein
MSWILESACGLTMEGETVATLERMMVELASRHAMPP